MHKKYAKYGLEFPEATFEAAEGYVEEAIAQISLVFSTGPEPITSDYAPLILRTAIGVAIIDDNQPTDCELDELANAIEIVLKEKQEGGA